MLKDIEKTKVDRYLKSSYFGAWGRPLFSRPFFSFLRPLSLFCHKLRCFSHSLRWAGVNWLPTMVVDLINWPNFSTWSLDWLMRVTKCWLMASGVLNLLPSMARPGGVSSEKSTKEVVARLEISWHTYQLQVEQKRYPSEYVNYSHDFTHLMYECVKSAIKSLGTPQTIKHSFKVSLKEKLGKILPINWQLGITTDFKGSR